MNMRATIAKASVAFMALMAHIEGVAADAATPAFQTAIAPLLAARCGACHGPDTAENGFRIDDRASAVAGGDSGSAGIVPGRPDASEVYVRVSTTDESLKMPADGEPLTADEQKLLRDWIAEGAVWPDSMQSLAELIPRGPVKPEQGSEHWAFQPLVRPSVPQVAAGTEPIDAFVQEALEARGLAMNPEADPRTLIRRLSFDLIGLPPSPEEITAFEDACRAAGGIDGPYRELTDRLLASPHYGERWARHWLDVVRFAESNGFETNTPRPNAWPYRDWVIESLNSDKPYDQFVKEQLYGDNLGADAATGFIVGGPKDEVTSPDLVLTANQRADELHDMVSTTGSALLGLTVGCARCHDHKFDPIPQRDYYRIKAVFAGVKHADREILPPDNADRLQKIATLERELLTLLKRITGEQVVAFPPTKTRFLRFTVLATTAAEPCIDELEVFTTDGRNVARNARASASGVYADGTNPLHKLEHINDGLYGNGRSWISSETGKGWVQMELPEEEEIARVVWSRDRSPQPEFTDRLTTSYEIATSLDGQAWTVVSSHIDRLPHDSVRTAGPITSAAELSPEELVEFESLSAAAAVLTKQIDGLKQLSKVYAGQFVTPAKTHRFYRGDAMQPREEVAPGSLTKFGPAWQLPTDASEADRRRSLADWIASATNPLTARVIVNRLWHHHFGTGIVDTPSDFGVNGGVPSHPALLDWLASGLVDPANPADRWRLKRLHRLIVTSQAYRQTSVARADALAADSGSRLLWRYPPRRLEAEALRDAILAVSGSFNQKMGGPGFDLFEPNTNYVKVYNTKTTFTEDDFRRMIYQSKPRAELDSFFGAFDCPDAGQMQPKRTISTTPLQALNMLNGDFLLDQANRFAARVEREVGIDPRLQVRRAVELAFGRQATDKELVAGTSLVTSHGLPILCRSLYNASEFITVY
jgi:mono/diheme cytochrome c family protein